MESADVEVDDVTYRRAKHVITENARVLTQTHSLTRTCIRTRIRTRARARMYVPKHAHRRTLTQIHTQVVESVEALRAGKFDIMGSLMVQSHESLRDNFEVCVCVCACVDGAKPRIFEKRF